ncbi:Putative F-box domain-containing protein [Septoria linicola]|uniref:F-box domain-containing protein n=1 Tax=Septoria linicola TaxID=215465 RepID=A0A9Q9AWT5_9PEZI|nr:putative F-box domain-containing protein [Septoria linicola]USW57352.1 Putative F-box domain-containing protein [Septoria linicola]
MFSRLPEELNEHILSYIDDKDKPTLGAVCRTNKLGNRIATPLFYKHVGVIGMDHESERKIVGLARLCQTQVNYPSRCDHVQSVELELDNGSAMMELEDYLHFGINKRQSSLKDIPYAIAEPIVEAFEDAASAESRSPRVALGVLLLLQVRSDMDL